MPASLTCKVLGIRPLRPDAFVLRCDRQGMSFQPGQHVNLGITGSGINREYSIYSAEQEPFLEFLVKVHPDSDSAMALSAVRPGDRISVAGPYGAFGIPPSAGNERRPVWLIAGGVGIAPFHGMVRSMPGLNYKVLHGVRSPEDAYDRADYEPSRLTLCCSRAAGEGFRGRVTEWLRQNPLPTDSQALICGSAPMVADTYECLRGQGLSSDRLITEVFF